MNAKKMLISLIPWIAFSVLVERVGANVAGYAALLAALMAFVLIVKDRAHGIKLIDGAGVVTFLALAGTAFAGSDAVRTDVAQYGRGICTLILAVVMLGSVLVLPFTEQYARESVPQQYWSSPVFKSVNRRISTAWGLVVLTMAGGHLVSGLLEHSGNQTTATNLVLNWAFPIALAVFALKYTNRVTAGETSAKVAV